MFQLVQVCVSDACIALCMSVYVPWVSASLCVHMFGMHCVWVRIISMWCVCMPGMYEHDM